MTEMKPGFDETFRDYYDNDRFDIDKALARLNEINRKLSDPEIRLYDAIDLYKEGTPLASRCEGERQGIEKQLNIIKPE